MSITVSGLYHTYHQGTPLETRAIEDISFECAKGEWLSVVGHTGSGKSTLAQHLNGILLPERGSVTVDGMEVREKSLRLCDVRRSVGLVFQYPEQQLFAENVQEEIAFAPRNWGVPEERIPALALSALSLAGLDETYLSRSPFHLSGGEKRKVAIASVLAGEPAYLVLDEPTAGLDSWSRKELVSLLHRLTGEGLGILFVTHDLDIALQHSDSILMLDHGRCVINDTPKKVMEYLQSTPVPGLHLPEIAALSSALRRENVTVPLTCDWKELKRWITGRTASGAADSSGGRS